MLRLPWLLLFVASVCSARHVVSFTPCLALLDAIAQPKTPTLELTAEESAAFAEGLEPLLGRWAAHDLQQHARRPLHRSWAVRDGEAIRTLLQTFEPRAQEFDEQVYWLHWFRNVLYGSTLALDGGLGAMALAGGVPGPVVVATTFLSWVAAYLLNDAVRSVYQGAVDDANLTERLLSEGGRDASGTEVPPLRFTQRFDVPSGRLGALGRLEGRRVLRAAYVPQLHTDFVFARASDGSPLVMVFASGDLRFERNDSMGGR